jgi:hypothetical protein
LQIASNDSLIRKGSLQSAECYVHFRHAPQRNGQIDIQYWFFYPYNSFGPGHEGDWEHITVRVTNNFNIRRIFFASHARESEWHRPTGFHLNNAGHPIVYSAIGSHACYWFAGKRDRGKFHTAEIPPDDFTANGGPVWKTWENLRIIGEFDNPLSNQEWIKYTGHWGEIGTAGTSELLVTSGPYGPAFQAWWDDDDEGNKSL